MDNRYTRLVNNFWLTFPSCQGVILKPIRPPRPRIYNPSTPDQYVIFDLYKRPLNHGRIACINPSQFRSSLYMVSIDKQPVSSVNHVNCVFAWYNMLEFIVWLVLTVKMKQPQMDESCHNIAQALQRWNTFAFLSHGGQRVFYLKSA